MRSYANYASRDKSVTNYFLGEPLKDVTVDNFKDLGVIIINDLDFPTIVSQPPT